MPVSLASNTPGMDKAGNNAFHEVIGGNFAGLIGITSVYPLDTAKTRIQMQPDQYKTILDVWKTLISKEGPKALYRGLSSPAVGFGFINAVAFNSYNQGCRFIAQFKDKNVNDLRDVELAMAGSYAGFVQSPVRQVFERMKSVMQMRETKGGKSLYSWFGPCAIDLVRQQGWKKGLFQGLTATTMREVPQYTVYYPSYEISKRFFREKLNNDNLASLLAGGTAGVVQWCPPIYCMDVIKTRMQTAEEGVYKGVLDCTQKLYKEGGVYIFFRGNGVAFMRAFPLHGIIFFTYENVMKILKKFG